MAKLAIKKASTDVTTYVFIQDSSKTTGEGLAGLAYNTASLVASYVRPLGTRQALTLATLAAADSAHSDGGFKEVDATNMPGVYRLDLPDAVCATGVPSVVVMLKGATNMSPVVLEIQLTDFDLNTAAITVDGIADAVWDEAISGHTTGTTFGGKNQKVVPSETINDYKADVSALTNVTLASSQPAITWGQQKIVANIAREGALDIRNSHPSGIGLFNGGGNVAQYNDGGSVGVVNEGGSAGVVNNGVADTGGGATAQQIWEYATRTITGLPTMPTDWLTAAGLKADAVSEIQSGLATASALDAVDNFIDTEVAAILAAVDTEVAAIKAKTDNLPASPAAVGSAMTLTAAYDKAKDDVLTPLGVVDGIVDAIKAQTDKIPTSPASAGEYTSALTAIQNDLDNPNQYKADVSNLALQATSLAIKGQTDKIPTSPAQTGEYNAALAAIQADLDNPDQYKADVSGLATQASVNAIPTTPLLAANYVAPDNATIGEIKAKTDNIPATPLTAQQVWEYVTRELTSQGSGGATAQEVWEYATRVLTAGTNIDLTPLAKTTHLQEVEDKVDGIKGITDQLTFTVPNKVDASATVDPTGIATSEGLDIIGGKVDGVLNKLNVSSVEYVTAVVGSTITMLRGDTLSARLLDLGDLTDYASIDFTVKRVTGELDDAAKLRLRKNASGTDDGLLRLNGESHTLPTDGSIVIDDLTTGDIEIKLNAAATRELVPGNYVYDVQIITANEVRTLTTGKATVTADVTRATA